MRGFISWFAGNHVAANLLMLFILIAGVVVGLGSKLEVFPETSMETISITTVYPGASPSEVEEGVITRIEENVAGVDGIKRIDSVAREGVGTVRIELMSGVNTSKVLDDVKSAVDRITTLPLEAEKPIVAEDIMRNQVIAIAVYGDAPEATLKHYAEKIKDDLTNLPQITQVEIFGARKAQISIEVSENTLRRYGLTLGAVAEAVRRASLDLPAGSIKTGEGEILVRTKGRRYYADDYRDIPIISNPDGTRVTLEQIALINEGFEDIDMGAYFQGKPGVLVFVYRVGEQNALSVAGAVKDFVDREQANLPHGVMMAHFSDSSQILRSRINLLLKNMRWGLVLVALLLAFFLNLRLAFWVTLGIPVSFAMAFLLLPEFDVSINMISLFAFIMVLGIVVDDAIVIGENIYRKREEGLPRLTAAIEGALEVGRPVVFSVLTTMAAFAPLLLGGGVMGKIMRAIPIVVILVLLGSLIECLCVLPSHLAGIARKKGEGQRPATRGRMTRAIIWFARGPYVKFLNLCLRWRYLVIMLAIVMLLISGGIWKGGWIKFSFFPPIEGDTLQAFVTMPVGTPRERTEQVLNQLEAFARQAAVQVEEKHPEYEGGLLEYTVALVGTQMGRGGLGSSSGAHMGQVWVQLAESEKRPTISSSEVTNAWRQLASRIQDTDSLSFTATIHRAGSPVEIHLAAADIDTLVAASQQFKAELESYPGVFDIEDSFAPGKQEIQLALKPAAQTLGISLEELARQVRHAFYGAEALRFQRGKDEVKVLARYLESERQDIASLENMRIRLADGSAAPFSQVAHAQTQPGYAAIERAQRMRVIKITADVNENITNADRIRSQLMTSYLPELASRYPGLRFTLEGEGREQAESLEDVFKGLLIALFAIYALLAIPFRSFTQPFIVMAVIPFGLVGALAGHMLMGYNLSIMSVFGLVGLAGVVVNNSLVLVDAVNLRRTEDRSIVSAVLEASSIRFRAVMLTSLTTFAGLGPMLFEKSLQARFLIPMAISLGFGVLFATFITLALLPCLYMMLEDIHNLWERIRRPRAGENKAA
ncbi:MAG: efflux RND transporter permease subunit [Desulfatibacillaceae bacterium]|nr:efflux RND transporter permease subunit [Desulfatibacillaceae bacterium]